jgi:hypothetical protein
MVEFSKTKTLTADAGVPKGAPSAASAPAVWLLLFPIWHGTSVIQGT